MEDDLTLFENLSDYDLLRKYVTMAVVSMKTGERLPDKIVGIFSPNVLDMIGELYSEINKLRK